MLDFIFLGVIYYKKLCLYKIIFQITVHCKCIIKKIDILKYIRQKYLIGTTLKENTIHSQMMKRLPTETLKYLLDIYNIICKEGGIPKTWKHTTKMLLLKEEKIQKILGAKQ